MDLSNVWEDTIVSSTKIAHAQELVDESVLASNKGGEKSMLGWNKEEEKEKESSISKDVYTMDHEVVPRTSEFVIGCWTRLGITPVYNKEWDVKVTMEFEVPQRHILRPLLFNDMVQRVLQWERQKKVP